MLRKSALVWQILRAASQHTYAAQSMHTQSKPNTAAMFACWWPETSEMSSSTVKLEATLRIRQVYKYVCMTWVILPEGSCKHEVTNDGPCAIQQCFMPCTEILHTNANIKHSKLLNKSDSLQPKANNTHIQCLVSISLPACRNEKLKNVVT